MNVGTLDRKTALVLVGGVAVILILRFVVLTDRPAPTVASITGSPEVALKHLGQLRQVAATVPAREDLLKQANAELDTREKGMLKFDTLAQAHAHLQEVLHTQGKNNGIDIRGMEDARVRLMGNDYGEASVYVRFSCRIEQLVNLLAALANEPELLSTNQVQITGGPDKNKVLQVRLGLSGVVAKKLAQEKRGSGF